MSDISKDDPFIALAKLLDEAGATLQIGLRQQGHMNTVRSMRLDGASWDEIGKAIGWAGSAVEQWFQMEDDLDRNPDANLIP